MHFGAEIKAADFGVKGQSSRSQWSKICSKQHIEGGGVLTTHSGKLGIF